MSEPANLESALNSVNTRSKPSELKITDMRFTEIVGAPMDCVLLRLYTNQGIVGLGEVRDFSSRTYASMLKGRLLGENPCDVERLFRRIRQFGGHGRQGGGVSGIEVALWDLAGKAYGVPVYQMLGGKYRDRIRMYCDTDVHGKPTATAMAKALTARMDAGFSILKMDLGINMLAEIDGALSAPTGYLETMRETNKRYRETSRDSVDEYRRARNAWFEQLQISHPHTAVRITERGLDVMEGYVDEIRASIGYEVPLAMDHFGHIGVQECIRLARRLERFSPAWLEDMIPWQLTEQYRRLAEATTAPICTGEDIYLQEGFRPLLESGAIAVAHPDALTAGGILETKKIADLAAENGVTTAFHMAESPVGALAAVHAAAASERFLACEFHSFDIEWWDDIVTGTHAPLVRDGFVEVPEEPGLGIVDFNDEVIAEHTHRVRNDLWRSTEEWDDEWPMDRQWS